jgi:hypothetical protein
MEALAISKQNYMTMLKPKTKRPFYISLTYSAQDATMKMANMNWSSAQEK